MCDTDRSTNLDRLDPGIAKRPSCFGRKYLFPDPNEEQRTAYMFSWQRKFAVNRDLEFPDKLCAAVAKITAEVSFAYLQEVMVASLLAIASDTEYFGQVACFKCLEVQDESSDEGACGRASTASCLGLRDYA